MIFDPIYLGLLRDNQNANTSDVLQMGPMLQKVVDICIPHRCTPILVHHTKKLGRNEAHRLLDLDDLSQAGFAEFARQWLLLSRRSEFVDECGHHELWMRTGGSAGLSSALSIDIQEGTLNNDILGQKWKVKVRSCKSFIQEKEKQKEEETQDKLNSIISKIVDYLSKQPAGDTQTASGIRLG